MANYKTEQESFWAGNFGDAYIARDIGSELLASNLTFFTRALGRTREVKDCIEFGANVGINLRALKLLFPKQQQYAIEINPNAAAELKTFIPAEQVFESSILEFEPERTWDLALIKGVLIHIDPEYLPEVYDRLYRAAGRYLLVCEYYNPSPVAIPYRGHENRLFKRDFCGEIMDRHQDLRLLDYGFVYQRDPNFPQDDITWFLMEKTR